MKSCKKREWAKLFLKISVSYVLSWRSLKEYQLWLDITGDGHRSVSFAHEVIFQKHLSGVETLLSSWDLLWLGKFCCNWYICLLFFFLKDFYMHVDEIMGQNSMIWALIIIFQNFKSGSNVTRSNFCVLSCPWLLDFKIRNKYNYDKIQPQSFGDSNSRGTSIQSPSFQ